MSISRSVRLNRRSPKSSPDSASRLRVALVCDWLTTPGGAEKVLLQLHRLYPDAPIYTSQYSRKGIDWFNDATVKTGWLQIFPAFLRKFLSPLRQIYFSHLDLSSYDLVISVTGAEAKSVRCQPRRSGGHRAAHLCYCHIPTQYYWQMYDKYIENPGFGFLDPLVRFALRLLVKPLRQADYRAAQLPDQFVTISTYARDQIRKYYDQESIVIAPPVDIAQFSTAFSTNFSTKKSQKPTKITKKSTVFPQSNDNFSTKTKQISTRNPQPDPTFSTESSNFSTGYYIIACRQATWKRIDLAIAACQQLNLPLLVVGDGPEHANLVKLAHANPQIKFLPWANTRELAKYLQGAKGYIFPSLEPFGIAAVEALAAGCPVIAYREGGSQDFIIDGVNGLLFARQTPESLVKALRKFEKSHFDRAKVSASAAKFSPEHFDQGINQVISTLIKRKPKPKKGKK